MSAITPEIIYPCPLSKGYGIPARQAWILLKVYLSYRHILAFVFIFIFYGYGTGTLININNSALFFYSSLGYLLISVVSAIAVGWRLTSYTLQAQLLILSDIVLLTLIMHACGGINSGLGTLLGVTIASSGLLIGGRCAIVFAALAALVVLAEQLLADYNGTISPATYTYSGMLGASFFTIALLSYVLAKRSEQTLQLNYQQKHTITKLEDLNQYIIQHLQSGILIINRSQRVQMANKASLRLLSLSALPINLAIISGQLAQAFDNWLSQPEQDSVLLKGQAHTDIYSRFLLLPTAHEVLYMIVFEDIVLYSQRVQQSKLVSLGRLTASIAHEIRNPLSAINQAGQLLSENLQLPAQDQRLIKIILTNTKRVNYIIEDILQLSRREDSRREKIFLEPWLNHYLGNFTLAQNIPISTFNIVLLDKNLCVFIDSGHLKQIMDNLCQNALRYGKPELGAIILQVQKQQLTPCIEVIDNGVSIDKEQINNIFEPFFTTSTSGTGLGLYISKELAELNQAKLSYHWTEENRSCFRLCLQDAHQTLIEI